MVKEGFTKPRDRRLAKIFERTKTASSPQEAFTTAALRLYPQLHRQTLYREYDKFKSLDKYGML